MKGGLSMSTVARKWGNSIGVRLPKVLTDKYNIVDGTELILKDGKKQIVISVSRKRPTLEELTSRCTPENAHDEVYFGREGRELL